MVIIALSICAFFVVITFFVRHYMAAQITRLIFDVPRLNHGDVLLSRKKQNAVPPDFDNWTWTTLEITSPWRGPMVLQCSPGQKQEKTAIFVHGTGTNRFSMTRYMRPYQELGYNIVFYDHPGHGAQTTPPPSYGWYEKGELDFVVERARDVFAETKLWVFHGESLGAGIIMEYLGAYPPSKGESRLGIIDCGFTDFYQVLKYRIHFWPFSGLIESWALGLAKKQLLNRCYTPLELLKPGKAALKAAEPLLLIHGLEDIRVPSFMSKNLYEQRKNFHPTELHLVSGARHCKSWSSNPIAYDSWVRDFLKKYGG